MSGEIVRGMNGKFARGHVVFCVFLKRAHQPRGRKRDRSILFNICREADDGSWGSETELHQTVRIDPVIGSPE